MLYRRQHYHGGQLLGDRHQMKHIIELGASLIVFVAMAYGGIEYNLTTVGNQCHGAEQQDRGARRPTAGEGCRGLQALCRPAGAPR